MTKKNRKRLKRDIVARINHVKNASPCEKTRLLPLIAETPRPDSTIRPETVLQEMAELKRFHARRF